MQISELYRLFCQYPNISIDSRKCFPDSIFFALKGEHFNGNDYVEQVLEAGTAYAIADRKDLSGKDKVIIVEDVLQTLQDLARYHRKKMNAKVIGITGTNGKTTTKELTAAILATKYSVLYTEGNLNNHIGVPLTLLKLNPGHQFAVVEMGANHPGEIRELCEIADPDYGLITNIGKAHLEGFGSLEGVINTKTELYKYIQNKKGIVFQNRDDSILKKLIKDLSVVSYGKDPESFIVGNIIESSPFLSIKWKKDNEYNKIKTHLIGNYNLENILAAVCIGTYFNINNQVINQALSDYLPSNNRSQKIKTIKNELILDAYNANPTSMQAALENFDLLNSYPKMVILGEMKELGKYSVEEHQKLLKLLTEIDINQVILVGKSFEIESSLPSHWNYFYTTDAIIEYLSKTEIIGYHVLIKGSRGNQLERIIPYL